MEIERLQQHLEPQGGLAEAAEDDLLVFRGVADGSDDLFRLRPVIQVQVVVVHHRAPGPVLGAEAALQGAAVGDVEVEAVADGVGMVRSP